MTQLVFYAVAPYELAQLTGAQFEGAEVHYHSEPLGVDSVGKAADAEVVSVFVHCRVTEEVLAALPRLRLVATRSTGYDHIDLEACRRRGIRVTNVPSYGENTVAEHAVALIFALARHLKRATLRACRDDYRLEGLEGTDLKGKTLGVIGAGRIGLNALRIGKGLGMELLAHDRDEAPAQAAALGYRYVGLEPLLATADVVSLHASLTPETHHLIGGEALRRMKRGALLINTARGPMVDTEALCEVLRDGHLGGAGLDVVEGEELLTMTPEARAGLTEAQLRQLDRLHWLAQRDDVVLTPHVAFFTREGVERLLATHLDTLREYMAGRLVNAVS